MSEELKWRGFEDETRQTHIRVGEYSVQDSALNVNWFASCGKIVIAQGSLQYCLAMCQEHYDARQSEENKKLAADLAIQAVRLIAKDFGNKREMWFNNISEIRRLADEVLRLLGEKP